MLKVILQTKGGKYKHQSQIISTKMRMWEAWKEEIKSKLHFSLLQGKSSVIVSFLTCMKKHRFS